MTIFCMSFCPGRSNIVSNKISSIMDLRPLAPVFLSNAFWEIALRASLEKSNVTSSISKSLLYCFKRAFFGFVRISTSASWSRSPNVAKTGSLPINSGIKPYLIRSSGSTSRRISPAIRPSGSLTSAPKPIEDPCFLSEIILSSPEKAPPQINKIFDVSTCKNSCCGCLRPPCGGTEAIVPSIIFNNACCTPSPETSRVIEGLSDFLLILSTSSM